MILDCNCISFIKRRHCLFLKSVCCLNVVSIYIIYVSFILRQDNVHCFYYRFNFLIQEVHGLCILYARLPNQMNGFEFLMLKCFLLIINLIDYNILLFYFFLDLICYLTNFFLLVTINYSITIPVCFSFE